MRIFCFLLVFAFISYIPSLVYAEQRTIEFNDIERSYIITKPSADEFHAPYPVIFVLHEGGGSGSQIQKHFSIEKEAHAEGFVTIFPEGIDKVWNDHNATPLKTHRPIYNDVGFFDAIVNQLAEEKIINSKYVFFTGVSNGGMMTMRMGCERADKIKAIAPIISNMPEKLGSVCVPDTPISVMMINGTEDIFIPRYGGHIMGKKDRGRVWSTPNTLEFWLNNAQCELLPELLNIPGGEEGTSQLPIIKYSYERCYDGISVYLFEIIGGGHVIPSSSKDYRPISLRRLTGNRAENLDAAVEIVDFFKSFITNLK